MSFTVDKTTNSKAIPTLKVPEASSANAIAKTRETGQQFSNLVRKEQKGAVNPEQQALTSVVDETRQVLEPLAKDKDAFNAVLKQAFGDDFDAGKAETLRQQILAGDYSWAPKVELVDSKQLGDTSGTQTSGRALGAYAESTDTIYLDRELVVSDPKEAKAVLLEEMGHAIDARINSKDAKGDEGAIFAKLASGEKISADKMQALKSENDKGVLKIDGKEIEVEYRFLPSIFPRRKKSFGIFRPRVPKYRYSGPGSSKSTGGLSTPGTKAKSSKPEPKPKSQGVKTYTDNSHSAAEADNPFSRVNPNNPTELMYGPFKPDYQPAVPKPVLGPPAPPKHAPPKPVTPASVDVSAPSSKNPNTYAAFGHDPAEADNPFSRINPNNPTGPLMYGPFKVDYDPMAPEPDKPVVDEYSIEIKSGDNVWDIAENEAVQDVVLTPEQQQQREEEGWSDNLTTHKVFEQLMDDNELNADLNDGVLSNSSADPDALNEGQQFKLVNRGEAEFKSDEWVEATAVQAKKEEAAEQYASYGHDPAEADNPFSRLDPNNPSGPLMHGPFLPDYEPEILVPPVPEPVAPSTSPLPLAQQQQTPLSLRPSQNPDVYAAFSHDPAEASNPFSRVNPNNPFGPLSYGPFSPDYSDADALAPPPPPELLSQEETDRVAKEIKKSLEFGFTTGGTDEDRLWAALETVPSSASMDQVRASYEEQFGDDDMDKQIVEDLRTSGEKQRARVILEGNDKTSQAEKDAAQIEFLRHKGENNGHQMVDYFTEMQGDGGSSRVNNALNQYEREKGFRYEESLPEVSGYSSNNYVYAGGKTNADGRFVKSGLSTPAQLNAVHAIIDGQGSDNQAIAQWGAERLDSTLDRGFLGFSRGIDKEGFEKTAAYFVENGGIERVQASFESRGETLTAAINDSANSSMQAEHVGTYLTQTRSERQSSDLAYEVKEKLGDDDKLLETLEGMGPEQIRQAMEADPELESTVLSSKNFRDGDLNSTQNAIKLSFENPLLDSSFNPESPQDVKKYNDWIVDYNAHALESAFAGLGTDDDKVDQILTNLTPKQLYEVTQQYDQNNDRSLSKRIKDEQGGNDEFDSMQAYEQAQKAGANPNDARYAGSQIEAENIAIANGQDPMQGIRAYVGEQARLRQETAERARSNDWNWKLAVVNPSLAFGAKALGNRHVTDTAQKVVNLDWNYRTDNQRIDSSLKSIEEGLDEFDAAGSEEAQVAAIDKVSRHLNLADQNIVLYRETKNHTAKGGASVVATGTVIVLSGGTATPLVVMGAAGLSGGATYYGMNQQAGGQAVVQQTALNSLNGVPVGRLGQQIAQRGSGQFLAQSARVFTTRETGRMTAKWALTDVAVGNGLEGGVDALIEHPNLGDASASQVLGTFGQGFGGGMIFGTATGGTMIGLGKGINAFTSSRAGKPEVLVPDEIIDPPSTRVPVSNRAPEQDIIDVEGWEVKSTVNANSRPADSSTVVLSESDVNIVPVVSTRVDGQDIEGSVAAPGQTRPRYDIVPRPKAEVVPYEDAPLAIAPGSKEQAVKSAHTGRSAVTAQQAGSQIPPSNVSSQSALSSTSKATNANKDEATGSTKRVSIPPSNRVNKAYVDLLDKVDDPFIKQTLPGDLDSVRVDDTTVAMVDYGSGLDGIINNVDLHFVNSLDRKTPKTTMLSSIGEFSNARIRVDVIRQDSDNLGVLAPGDLTPENVADLNRKFPKIFDEIYGSESVLGADGVPMFSVRDTLIRLDELGVEGTKEAIQQHVDLLDKKAARQYLKTIGLTRKELEKFDNTRFDIFLDDLKHDPGVAAKTFDAVKLPEQKPASGPEVVAYFDGALSVELTANARQLGVTKFDIDRVRGVFPDLDVFVLKETAKTLGLDDFKATINGINNAGLQLDVDSMSELHRVIESEMSPRQVRAAIAATGGPRDELYVPAAYIYKNITRSPGDFSVIAGINSHLDGETRIGAEFRALMSVAEVTGQNVILNPKWGAYKQDAWVTKTDYKYFDDIVDTLLDYPDASVTLTSTGIGRFANVDEPFVPKTVTIRDLSGKVVETKQVIAPEHVHKLYELFDRLPHLKTEVPWNDIPQAYVTHPELRQVLVDFVIDHQDRIAMGSDDKTSYMLASFIPAVAKENPQAAFKLLYKNYGDWTDNSLHRLYAWTEDQAVNQPRIDVMRSKGETLAQHRQVMLDRARKNFAQWHENLSSHGADVKLADNPGVIANLYRDATDAFSKTPEIVQLRKTDTAAVSRAVKQTAGASGATAASIFSGALLTGLPVSEAVALGSSLLASSVRGVADIGKYGSDGQWIKLAKRLSEIDSSTDAGEVDKLLSRKVVDKIQLHLLKNHSSFDLTPEQALSTAAVFEQLFTNYQYVTRQGTSFPFGHVEKEISAMLYNMPGTALSSVERLNGVGLSSLKVSDPRTQFGMTVGASKLLAYVASTAVSARWLADVANKADLSTDIGRADFAARSLITLGLVSATTRSFSDVIGGAKGLKLSGEALLKRAKEMQYGSRWLGSGFALTAADALKFNDVLTKDGFTPEAVLVGGNAVIDLAYLGVGYLHLKGILDKQWFKKSVNELDEIKFMIILGSIGLLRVAMAIAQEARGDDKRGSPNPGAGNGGVIPKPPVAPSGGSSITTNTSTP